MSDFKAWAAAMGFHGKQVGKAGAAIGIGAATAQTRYRGDKDPNLTERLAMAAITAGLPAWTPANHGDIQTCGKLSAIVFDDIKAKSANDPGASRTLTGLPRQISTRNHSSK
jgi:hypothetical protein